MKIIFLMICFIIFFENTAYAHGGEYVAIYLSLVLVSWITALILIIFSPYSKQSKRLLFGVFFLLSIVLFLMSPPPIYICANLAFYAFLSWKIVRVYRRGKRDLKDLY